MPIDERLEAVMDDLLNADQDISARAAARALGIAPTTITRNTTRMELVGKYQAEQERLRSIAMKADKTSKANLSRQIDLRDRTIAELEPRVHILTASHKAMLLAVGEIGGISAWRRFFEKYDDIKTELMKLNAMPDIVVKDI